MNKLQESGVFVEEKNPLIYDFSTNDLPINYI